MTEDTKHDEDRLYRALARAIYLAAGVFLLFWFLDLITVTLLFFAFAVILALALNPPVTWLEQKGLPRVAATLVVFLGLVALLGLFAWLVVPTLVDQVTQLASQVPDYVTRLRERADRWLTRTPQIENWLQLENLRAERVMPALQALLMRVGRYSLTLVTLVLFLIILASTVVYALANPRPLLDGYLSVFPPHRQEQAARAFARSSQTVVGWIWANLIVGAIEGVAAALFLWWMGIPGAFLWGTFTLFSELVPKLGPYLMTIPPVLIALAIDPMDALWVLLFYMALQEITGDVIGPLVRSSQMQLHPVSTIFAVLAMGSAFGLLGALIATPVAGIVKAYYDEFHGSQQPKGARRAQWVEAMLHRRTGEPRGSTDESSSQRSQ